MTWESDLRPALIKQFPNATPQELQRAHSFAYGGAVVMDVGYYPFANHRFTDLVHYVRTGDFVAWMIRDARNVEEYAFALGALSHYAADSWGHESINLSVPVEYPRLRKKFGKWVTYEDDHEAHLRTEFSFDVLEVAKHRYNNQQYHDYIGFDVSEDQLERAFLHTYGFSMDELLHFDDLALETFRFAVARVIPEMTEVALATHKEEIEHEYHDRAKTEFLYHLSKADYEKQFGTKYRHPGIFARILGFLIHMVPLGPAKILGYRPPTRVTEDYYFRSTDQAFHHFQELVHQVNSGNLNFANRNLDTGALTREGDYRLADQTYALLARQLAKDGFAHLTPSIKADLLEYFAGGAPSNGCIKPRQWRKTEAALAELKQAVPADSANTPGASR